MVSQPSRSIRTLVGVAVLTAGVAVGGGAASAGNDKPDDPLRIMVTNDDGWQAEGITAVYDALVAAGYDVTMVAPAGNQSGMGGRVTLTGPLVVSQPEAGKFAVEGTPADATEFGLSTLYAGEPPDLVISGTNIGQNIAAAEIHSGTVAAAATSLNEGVPAIAVSTEVPVGSAVGEPDFAGTADFTVELVEELDERSRGGALLPEGLGLNVNYPLVTEGETLGDAVLVNTGTGFLDGTYEGAIPGVGESTDFEIVLTLKPETVADSDTEALADNNITITPINGNYDAGRTDSLIRRVVKSLNK
ncbi:MAG: 5'/3'-nucleotidase SurE [Acidimicrobiales bacterium]